MGELLESAIGYTIKTETIKKLCRGEISANDLTENDFKLDIQQKGVDTRICLDIASLSYKQQVDQIILIAGDSDFVPAAKHARREGIDFILDPMWHTIKPNLNEHIDGLQTKVHKPGSGLEDDPLYMKNSVIVHKTNNKKPPCRYAVNIPARLFRIMLSESTQFKYSIIRL